MKKQLNKTTQAKLQLILSMFVFGTIGIFRKYIPYSSSLLALIRGIVGTLFLVIVVCMTRKKIDFKAFKENALYLILSGTFIGFNWILLFEAYNNTSVAVATLCYYMAPVIVMLLSPILLKESLNRRKWLCIISAVLGMVFVSGVLNNGISNISEIKGVLFGLGAATLYALVVLLNQKIKSIDPYSKTIFQLGLAAITLLPYILLTENLSSIVFSARGIFLLLFVGVVHTGFTYYLYFGSMAHLKAQTVALYSYIDPIVAIIMSALVLKESFGTYEAIGTLLILGSTIVCEFSETKK